VPSLLEQLDRRESVLLMYIAGELSPRELKEVERRLTADPGLAADLERLRAVQDTVLGGLAELDAADPLPVEPSIVAKRVGDVLRQRLSVPAARRARPAAKAPLPYDVSRRFVGWAAVAAAIAVGASVAPQVIQLWRGGSSPSTVRVPGNPGGVASDPGLEMEINRLALDDWAHPEDKTIEALAETTDPKEDADPNGSVAINSGAGLDERPVFDIPMDLPEPAQP
jgi:hypothetical protein